MRTSKNFLPDVNVWLGLVSQRHIHSQICSLWINGVGSATIAFCRVSQMGLLRLLTTESVMGRDVLSSASAWHAYGSILVDERVVFAPEPMTLEMEWKRLIVQDKPAPKVWTDAYLAAFAQASGMRVVTLDQAMMSLAPEALVLK